MRLLKPLEIGLMFWVPSTWQQDQAGPLSELQSFGLRAGQLGIPGELSLPREVQAWQQAIIAQDVAIATAVCSYSGESYADIPTVEKTVGLVPAETRRQRIDRTKAVSDFAATLDIPAVACHIGFIPHDRNLALYAEVVDVARDLCDHCAQNRQAFALETGQEPMKVLLQFIEDVDRANLKINFDPANLILYGTGDPLQAFDVLAPYVISVHCKDGNLPSSAEPGALGRERCLGDGSVDFPQFIGKLLESGYQGILSIEREESDLAKRAADIQHGIRFLRTITGPQAE